RGASFLAYYRYAQCLETSLTEIFSRAMSLTQESIPKPKVTPDRLLTMAHSAIQVLLERNENITGEAVASIVKIPRSSLIIHEEIATLIGEATAEQKRRTEKSQIERAERFLADNYPKGATCSQDALANHLSISRTTLRRSEPLMNLLRKRA